MPAAPHPLDQIHIASPCTADWNAMSGDDRVRFCGECRRHVYNLAELPRSEAEQLLLAKAGNLCLRIYQRTDGTVLTADCPRGAAVLRTRLARAWAGIGMIVAFLLLGPLNILGMKRTAAQVRRYGALHRMGETVAPESFELILGKSR